MATTTTTNKITPSKSLEAVEQFPDMLPDTGAMFKKWIWKDETNSLELISTGLQATADRQLLNFHKTKKSNKNLKHSSAKNYSKTKKTAKQTMKAAVSPKPSMKIHTSEKRSINLNDVKGVCFDLLSESGDIAEPFKESLRSDHFDGLLTLLLHYFDAFFDHVALENKPKAMATEPSAAEAKATLLVIKRQEAARRLLAEQYCTLIMGLRSEEQHHMACGKQRKSCTKKDRTFYETLYLFCCFVVWITFRRNNLEQIQQELGRLFRSQSFNPYGRPTDDNEFQLASDLTSQEIHNIRLAPSSLRKNKRPPIKSIINQRSPVLVSLLPNSKESSSWLLDRRKALSLHIKQESYEENLIYDASPEKLNVGIIGEMISGFNPFTLAPFGDDGEEEEEDDEENINEETRRRSFQANNDKEMKTETSGS